jgi:hypothetical protein
MDSTSRARRDADAMPADVAYSRSTRAEEANMNVNYSVEGAKYGISFGTALAIAISYTNNHSILWAIIHGFFSWFYVIYFALFK